MLRPAASGRGEATAIRVRRARRIGRDPVLILAMALAMAPLAAPSQFPHADARAFAEEQTNFLPDEAVPKSVAALLADACDIEPGTISRRRFDGGVLFSGRCPGNNQNYTQALVRASNPGGPGAEQIALPPGPDADREPTVVSNARIFAGTRTIGEILVATEAEPGDPCRMESLWRLRKGRAHLVFYRRTRDCEVGPRTTWTVVVDKRTPAERRDRW